MNKLIFISAMLGVIAWFVPSVFFIYQNFKKPNARNSQTIIMDFYVGEIVKLLFSGILVVLFVHFLPLKIVAFLSGYICAIFIMMIIPFFCIKK